MFMNCIILSKNKDYFPICSSLFFCFSGIWHIFLLSLFPSFSLHCCYYWWSSLYYILLTAYYFFIRLQTIDFCMYLNLSYLQFARFLESVNVCISSNVGNFQALLFANKFSASFFVHMLELQLHIR